MNNSYLFISKEKNTSSKDLFSRENTLEQTVTAVYGVSSHERTTTDSNFFFTESESEIATERATSSFFERFNPQRETTTPPPYKVRLKITILSIGSSFKF